ncbi:ATP-binding protein [Mesoterricola sediminis]|uniref:histidine kinase n=1 Tax=Mesoterricola sediminis TaxID=2927980 RepID=A0AA48KEG7_9BACT|nr:ATP-binding protein [Mesoterricola sediminis]BDU78050.1 hypothetical protein METESE_30080 [Mesoterricola sediminis]
MSGGSRPVGVMRLVLLYAGFSALWILLSDQVVSFLVRDPARLALVNTLKGWLFVGVSSLLLYRGMGGLPEGDGPQRPRGWRRIFQPAAMAALAILLLAWFGAGEAMRYQERKEGARLHAIAELKARQTAEWIQERTGDAEFTASSSVWSEAYRKWKVKGLDEGRQHIMGRLEVYREARGFSSMGVLDGGAWVLPQPSQDVAPEVGQAAEASALDQRVRVVGPYRDAGGRLHLDFLAPLRAPGGGRVPVVVFGADMARQVHARLQDWPSPSTTGEAILFRRDGDDLLPLTDSRFQEGLALNRRWPLATSSLVGARVLRGEVRPGTWLKGLDFRDRAIAGVVVPVAGTDWFLLAKMDQEEIVAASRNQVAIIGLAALLGLFLVGISAHLFRQQRLMADTRRERAVQAERLRTLRLLDSIASGSSDAIFAFDRRGRRLVFNPVAERVFGKREGDSVDPEAARALAAGEAVLVHGRTDTVEEILPTSAGPRTFLVTRGPLREEEGSITGHFGIARDITELKWTQRRLAAQNRFLERIVAGEPIQALLGAACGFVRDLAPDAMAGILLVDEGAGGLKWTAYAGLPPGLIEARPVIPLQAGAGAGPSGRCVAAQADVVVEDLMTDPACDLAMRHHLGSYGIRAVWATPILAANGRVLGAFTLYRAAPGKPSEQMRTLMATAAQVTSIALERDREERALVESGTRFRQLFEAAPVPMCLLGEAGRVTALNSQFTRTFGYSLDEVPALTDWLHASRPGGAEAAWTLRTDPGSGIPVLESTVACRDGGQRTVLVSATALGGESLLTLSDITDWVRAESERQRLQEEVQQAQKLESIGRLAGGVAHDFNNMLGVIVANADMGILASPPGRALDRFEEIKKAAVRSTELTRQLLAFARKQATSPKVLDLNHAIPDMIQMLTRLIGENITLDYGPADGLWRVRMDPAQLDQVLANLTVNARDAIAGIGRMWIRTENVTVQADPALPHRPAGDFVVLEVGDTGCGMDPEQQKHIFEPFFTTKAVGRGTGLGLATVYGIVEQNSGFIEVESAPGRGTRFRVHLPRCGEAEAGEVLREEKAPARRGGETILVVEDEPMNLEVAQMLLETLGYTVLPAATPAEALAIMEGPVALDLLLTDVIMPGMNGRDLAAKARGLRPDLRVLYMSGYTADVIATQGSIPEEVQLLDKPFTLEELAARVRAVLDAPSGLPLA